MNGHGLMNTDEELYAKSTGKTRELVKAYAENEKLFLEHFAVSMVKMGNMKESTLLLFPVTNGRGLITMRNFMKAILYHKDF